MLFSCIPCYIPTNRTPPMVPGRPTLFYVIDSGDPLITAHEWAQKITVGKY